MDEPPPHPTEIPAPAHITTSRNRRRLVIGLPPRPLLAEPSAARRLFRRRIACVRTFRAQSPAARFEVVYAPAGGWSAPARRRRTVENNLPGVAAGPVSKALARQPQKPFP